MCAYILSVNKQILFFFFLKGPDSSSLSSLRDLVYITLSSQNTLYLALSPSQSLLSVLPACAAPRWARGPKPCERLHPPPHLAALCHCYRAV